MRLATLSRQSLDNDEAYTAALRQHSFGGMLSLFRIEANGLLYPLADWLVARLSDGVTAFRSPALVAGVVAVPLVYLIEREVAAPRVAALGAALLALNPAAIAQSQNDVGIRSLASVRQGGGERSEKVFEESRSAPCEPA